MPLVVVGFCMPFKRTYPVEGGKDLYVTVLVECDNCGMQDSLTDEYEVEFVNDQFHSVEDIEVHADCPLCGKHEWAERMEHLKLGIPKQLQPKSYTMQSIDTMVNEVETFHEKLTVAQKNDFLVCDVQEKAGRVVLVNRHN